MRQRNLEARTVRALSFLCSTKGNLIEDSINHKYRFSFECKLLPFSITFFVYSFLGCSSLLQRVAELLESISNISVVRNKCRYRQQCGVFLFFIIRRGVNNDPRGIDTT